MWPPAGAVVTRVVLREEATATGARTHVAEGEAPGPQHLRALQWLLGEHSRDETPASVPGVVDVLLEIARTSLAGGRVGHAYALDGAALGAPSNHGARGVVWRYALARLGGAAPEFDPKDADEI
jgi:hypothetical protein